MCFFISLIPATIWLVIGYIVLFISSRSEGQMQKFGRVLAIWVFIIAAFIPIMGLVLSISDLCPIADLVARMHD